MNNDEKFMSIAIENSKKMIDGVNEPFTAILVDEQGNIVATNENKIVTKSDPSWHSEMALIRQFCNENKTLDLSKYTLYANGEPCAMCAALISWTNVGKLIYAVPTESLNNIKGPNHPSLTLKAKDIISHGTNKVEVVGPILEEEGKAVFEEFFQKQNR